MPVHDDRDPVDREILDIIPERFDVDADSLYARKSAHTRLILGIALALLVVAAVGATARHIFFGESSGAAAGQAGVPVIKADDKPIKTRPDDRGGMEVPNQDKLVYERMGSSEGDGQNERLLPPPEQPQMPPVQQPRKPSIKPAFPAPPPRETPVTAKPAEGETPPPPASAPQVAVASLPAKALPAPHGTAPASTTAAATQQPAPPPPTAAKPAPAAKPAVVAKPAAPAAAVTKPATGGKWLVQLAALKTEAEAKTEWNRVRAANKDLLGDLGSDIVRVDLGAKGIFWRVRAGPLEEARARTICSALAKRSQGCIVGKK